VLRLSLQPSVVRVSQAQTLLLTICSGTQHRRRPTYRRRQVNLPLRSARPQFDDRCAVLCLSAADGTGSSRSSYGSSGAWRQQQQQQQQHLLQCCQEVGAWGTPLQMLCGLANHRTFRPISVRHFDILSTPRLVRFLEFSRRHNLFDRLR
jgi:hypothetical protein